ncbi:DUF3817 domain-containing protein [Pseudoclavibacter sp. CFCC 13796]|uniref:DUF3817 domain-containing protein n=1 Tax=Pseudoclavibacter sp. CFCC 13796 TaxID=2615179 RepID=UPI00130117E3|nr:DUF3817 domain-containing protein [Pseudoclavibacter sp. CFCC 13796]KAB1661143.1 DUF3817 domain-containing protein [Pseudoclavibacter sp. CFCC 13796]
MTRQPILPKRDRQRIPGAIRFYSIFAYITGVFLLLLCAEMILKYIPWNHELGVGYEVFAGGGHVLNFVPSLPEYIDSAGGLNLSIGVLIVHGWLYVVYLISDFRLWTLLRWPLRRFVAIALGGIVPFLSFFVEHRMSRAARKDLAEHNARAEAHDEAILALRKQVADDEARAATTAAPGAAAENAAAARHPATQPGEHGIRQTSGDAAQTTTDTDESSETK